MPLIRCAQCDESTFAFSGWSDVDHCAHCGARLDRGPVDIEAVLRVRGALTAEGPPAHESPTTKGASNAKR
jgi:hypothetical protein